ncbi:MAG TPA: dihydropteroate synthase [Actinomycetes bacterium]|nr:dihydropteroate synthase [Actinomycetes bacterium]
MGVLNVTPDSFSDGGSYLAVDAAVTHGLEMRDEGADLVDVGGESTRPGAQRVDEAEELRRVVPVVEALAAAGVVVSIDTMRSRVASAALDAGAAVVNDVSGGLADQDMAAVVASSTVPYVAMHWRGHSADMADRAVYDDVVADVVRELQQRLDALVAAGVDAERVVLDPGIGFAKDADHNWALLANLDRLAGLGRPLLVGASRKGFLGRLLGGPDGAPRDAEGRDVATAVLSAVAAPDVWCLRVHAVRPTVDALRVVAALRSARVGS